MNRITEPSTWAGVGIFGQLLAAILPPQWAWVGHGLSALGGTAAIKLREQPPS